MAKNVIDLLLENLAQKRMPVLAKVQPSEARLLEVHKIAMEQIGELISIAKLVHSEPYEGKDPGTEKLYYMYAPLLVGTEVYLARIEAGGMEGVNKKVFRELQLGLIDIVLAPLQ